MAVPSAPPATRIASPYLLLTLTPFFWACNWIVGRGLHAEIPPMAMTFYRWFFALLILAPFGWRLGGAGLVGVEPRRPADHPGDAAVVGLHDRLALAARRPAHAHLSVRDRVRRRRGGIATVLRRDGARRADDGLVAQPRRPALRGDIFVGTRVH